MATASVREIRKKLKRRGFHWEPLADASGPPTTTYHDPNTGQEFHNLPMDPYSLERYMKIHRWNPGPAPAELREKWARMQAELEDPLEEYRAEGEQIIQEHTDKVKETVGEDMLALLQKMANEISELKAKVNGQAVDSDEPVMELPTEPTQLEFDVT